MVHLKRFKLSCPNTGLLFLIAGMAVGNYSYEKYQQNHLNRESSRHVRNANVEGPSEDKILPSPVADTQPHPLDPLNALEMQQAARIVRSYNSSSEWQFKRIGLREPDKTLIYPYFQTRTIPPAGLVPRRANVLICDPTIRHPIFVIVNLSAGKVEAWREANPGEKVATATNEDNSLMLEILFNDPSVLARLHAKGYNDPRNQIIADIWDSGYVADNPNYSQALKLVQAFLYATKGPATNYYAHPLDFIVVISLGPNKVLGIENLPIQQGFDTSNRRGDSIPTADDEYMSRFLPPNSIRRDLNRLQISQPEGPSFKITGREVTWQNFNFRLGYSPRDGFYINTITFNDNGKIRPIIYRLSMGEAYLSYGDPRPPFPKKTSYDMGNGEFGSNLRTLPVRQFCRGNPYYFESDHHTESATTWVLQNSLCVVEEDAGILWAHQDDESSLTEAVRNQRLALTSLFTYENIDYIISWRFYLDATIELSIKITGPLSTNLMAVDVKAPDYGILLMPQVLSQNYQHLFAVRIDADIDGLENTVSVEDIVRVSERVSPENPYGNGITTRSVDLTTPATAATDSQPNRSWKISNPNLISNPQLGWKPPSWRLLPGPMTPSMLTPDSPFVESRLSWTKHNMWVLPYDVDQMYASGEYFNGGVNYWTNQNANVNITNSDVVLWHVFNYVYTPDVEDWPAFSSNPPVGFRLRPSNFLSKNPALYSTRAKDSTLFDGIGVGTNSGSGWRSSPEL